MLCLTWYGISKGSRSYLFGCEMAEREKISGCSYKWQGSMTRMANKINILKSKLIYYLTIYKYIKTFNHKIIIKKPGKRFSYLNGPSNIKYG